MGLKLVTDSAADLPENIINHIIPIHGRYNFDLFWNDFRFYTGNFAYGSSVTKKPFRQIVKHTASWLIPSFISLLLVTYCDDLILFRYIYTPFLKMPLMIYFHKIF